MTDQRLTGPQEGASLQEQVDKRHEAERQGFGTFAGVFTPTLLTILGVIMYLRLGSVVGNAGLIGAWAIIGLSFGITTMTALSMSSITTNIRIGAGGAYSIISQSLGLEVGGAIGIPLYLSQALAVAMYVFGFRAGWLSIFPEHPALLVDLGTFAVLFAIATISANLAFRVQYVIMAIIAASLVAIFATLFTGDLVHQPQLFGDYPGFPETGFEGTGFWIIFAIFFPAATGIMAGANLSGDLANPRRSIPVGTLSAIGISFVIYMAVAWWLARVATPDELTGNYTIMIDKALWGPAVLAGLLGATFSSGLSSLVGAPRILQALATHRVLPGSGALAKLSDSGEPRNALYMSAVLVVAALMLRDLNAIAPLIAMFFLITYAMLNVVILFEQSLGLVSFRPLLRLPRLVPLLGVGGSIFAMFIINPAFSLVAVILVAGVYVYLVRRHLAAPFGDMRSGLFVAMAEWAATQVAGLPLDQERAWKPNILTPVEDPREIRGTFQLLRDITRPRGSVRMAGLTTGSVSPDLLAQRLPGLSKAFREEGVFSSWTLIDAPAFGDGVISSMQAISGGFFRPNILFLALPPIGDDHREEDMVRVAKAAQQQRIGLVIYADHPKARLGREQSINVWVRDRSPDWDLDIRLGNLDLALLIGYKVSQNWNGSMTIITAVEDEAEVGNADEFLTNLTEVARLPDASVLVKAKPFAALLAEAPVADVNIFGLHRQINLEFARRMVEQTGSACLFVRDSGNENILA